MLTEPLTTAPLGLLADGAKLSDGASDRDGANPAKSGTTELPSTFWARTVLLPGELVELAVLEPDTDTLPAELAPVT